MSAYESLLKQIDAFIKKYYRNQVLKGFLMILTIFLVSLLVVSGLEFIGHFNQYVRGFLFFVFIGLNVGVASYYFIVPLLKFYSFGKRIDQQQASKIIGSFFPQISDRLLNTLQLNENVSEGSIEIIRASVRQRAKGLSAFEFTQAVNFKDNLKYVKLFSPVFILFLCVAVFLPEMLKDGTKRVVLFQEEFVRLAPFDFVVQNESWVVDEGDDFLVQVKLQGNSFPDKVYLNNGDGRFLMNLTKRNEAGFWLENVDRSQNISFSGNEFNSKEYLLKVVPKSSISMVKVGLIYPKYLSKPSETLRNVGDLVIPEGTEVSAVFLAKNSDKVVYKRGNSALEIKGSQFQKRFMARDPERIVLVVKNGTSRSLDTSYVNISVVKDQFPSIGVSERKDSMVTSRSFFSGQISDDYGVSKLEFVYSIVKADGRILDKKEKVNQNGGLDQPFSFAVDFAQEKLELKDRIDYHFVVYDNDGVNGSKASRSQSFSFKVPDFDELKEKRADEQNQIEKKLEDVLRKSNELKADLKRLKKEALNKQGDSWKMKNEVNRLQMQQESLTKDLKNLKNKMEQSVGEKNQLSEMDKELMEKQREIDKLLEELMDDEMRDLLKKLDEMLEKQNKEGFQDEMEKLENKADEQNNQLDRSLEMLKKLKVNEKIDDLEKSLKELAKDQEKLKLEQESRAIDKDSAVKEQEKINEKFDKLDKELENIHQLNKGLDRPMPIGEQKELREKIKQELEGAKSDLQKGKKGKAGEQQKGGADDMNKMAEELNNMQEDANEQQAGEDLDLLKQILKNLMTLSFDQEENMKRFTKVNDADPAYQKYGRNQRKIIGDTKSVADSMMALAKRQPKIASFVDGELSSIKDNQMVILESIDEHRRREIGVHQQYVMTSYNNLALLLNESLESMQNQMKNAKPGEGSCNKPGGKGKPKPGEGMGTKDMKEMLKDQLEQMEKGMGKGKKPGEGSGSMPGNKGKPVQGGLSSKQLSKMAAEQSAIRQRLEQMRNELNKDGKGSGNELNKLLDELEKQEQDLINRYVDRQLINRQHEILTRLLESEKALKERGFDEKRESKPGKEQPNSNLIRFDEYNKEKLRQIEMLKSVDPGLRKYYKDKANDYFNLTL
jgi:hypothetical protein